MKGTPSVVVGDWTKVRDLTDAEKAELGCTEPPAEVVPAAPSFTDPTCEAPEGAAVLGADDTESVDYTVAGDVRQGGDVTVTAVAKEGFVFAEGAVTEWTHHFTDAIVCGVETVKPKPTKNPSSKPSQAPTVLGTQAVVPTAVDAGLASYGAGQQGGSSGLVGQLLLGAGVALLLMAGAVGLGRRTRGSHEA